MKKLSTLIAFWLITITLAACTQKVTDTADNITADANDVADIVASGAAIIADEAAVVVEDIADAIDTTEDVDAAQEPVVAQKTTAPAEYVDYSAAIVDQAIADGKEVVLFFHAPRCPSCRLAEKDIKENLSTIQDNVVVVKVDYDSAPTAMKQRYGVASQHTFVLLNKQQDPRATYVGGDSDEIKDLF
jgi:thiol-disulfide isomerase/thioredoxin